MMSYLCLSVTFLDGTYHGRRSHHEPEWPPSPLRVFQALLAAAARRSNVDVVDSALSAVRWLEQQSPPMIVAATGRPTESPYRLYVPDNVGDKVAGSWARGGQATIAKYRPEKDVFPIRLPDFGEVHYLFPLDNGGYPQLDTLAAAARSITHLGWGVDMVVANATTIADHEAVALSGERWQAVNDSRANGLRVPIPGTLDALISRHQAFLNRITRDARGNESFDPVPPLSAFRMVGYRRPSDPAIRQSVIFELRNDDGSFFRYPQRQLIHLAGMVRHLAIELMEESPPNDVDDGWVETYIAGHAQSNANEHRQLSYLPLPSIGKNLHTDPSVRRVMILAPVGDDHVLQHLAIRLSGQRLKPTRRTKLDHPPTLVRVQNDKVAHYYTKAATNWASVTPVILPGHDDHKPQKTQKLVEKALQQSGIEQPCEFEWSSFSQFPKSLSAHKYDREKRPSGYIRPDHLLSQTAVHLKLRFNDGLAVPGPLVVGAGRHCGLGLLAGVDP